MAVIQNTATTASVPEIQWQRIEAGEYRSLDGRWEVLKVWDRLYGDHWQLTDNTIDDYYKKHTACDSLKHAKHVASLTVQRETGAFKSINITDDMF